MAFRDDREVLKQKARDLERDLAEAEGRLATQKGEAERVKRLEDDLAEARGVLDRIQAQLPKPASSSARRTTVLAVVLLCLAGGGAFALTRSSSVPRLPPATTPPDLNARAKPSSGNATCDKYWATLRACNQAAVESAPAPAKAQLEKSLAEAEQQTKEAWAHIDGSTLEKACGAMIDALKQNPNCPKQ